MRIRTAFIFLLMTLSMSMCVCPLAFAYQDDTANAGAQHEATDAQATDAESVARILAQAESSAGNKDEQTVTATADESTIACGSTTSITVEGIGAIVFASNNERIATVDQNGVVTANYPGEVDIVVVAVGNSTVAPATATVQLTVVKAPNEVTITPESATVKAGETLKVAGAGVGAISYVCNNSRVATVDDEGNVTALRSGEAVIYAAASGSETVEPGTASMVLTVAKADNPVTATVQDTTISSGSTTSIVPDGVGAITYSSSDARIATVDDDGVVTGVLPGMVDITVTAAGDDAYAPGEAVVKLVVIKAENPLTVSPTTVNVVERETAKIEVSAAGAVTFSSNNPGVATVSADGVVTGVSAGTAIVTVFAAGDEYAYSGMTTVSIVVSPGKSANSASVSPSSLSMLIGDTAILSGAGEGELSYSSSDTAVATVDANGVVTAVAPGTATITLQASGDDNHEAGSAQAVVTVSQKTATPLDNAKVTGVSKCVYTGSAVKLANLKVALDGKTLVKGTDYSVKYKNNVNAGTASVTIKGKGEYSGSITKEFKIVLGKLKVTSAKLNSAGQLQVEWRKPVAKCNIYRVWLKVDSKTYSWDLSKTSSNDAFKQAYKSRVFTVGNLTAGKTYKVKVRALLKANGKSSYVTKWSKVKSVKA